MAERLRGARPAGRHGPHVPRRGARPAPPLLAASPRRRAAARRPGLEDPDRRPAGPRPARAATASRRPRTSPTRSSGPRAGASRPTTLRARAPRDRTPPHPGRAVRPPLRRLRARRRSGPAARLRRHADPDGRPAGDRRGAPRGPRPQAAGSASTSTRTRTRSSSASWSCGSATATTSCVVGDEDQTIYTFAGATSAFLRGFATRFPGARRSTLDRNYRTSPEILELANRLLAAEGRPQAAGGDPAGRAARRRSGAAPTARPSSTLLVAPIRRLVAEGVAPAEIAVLVRMNAQLPPLEEALTQGRHPVPRPRAALLRAPRGARGAAAPARGAADRARPRGRRRPGGAPAGGSRLRPRRRDRGRRGPRANRGAGAACWDARRGCGRGGARLDGGRRPSWPSWTSRAAAEAEGSADGVNLLTLHRAKGLEWDAVLLPGLEEGTLPIRQAVDDDEAIDRGAAAALRRPHPRPPPPAPLVGRAPGRVRRPRVASAAEPVPAGAGDGRRDRGRRRDGGRRVGRRFRARVSRRHRPPGRTVARRGRRSAGRRAAPRRPARLAHRPRPRADAVPAYVVAHDAAAARDRRGSGPHRAAALRRIKGMGPAKLDRYGDEILAILARH